MSRAATTKLYRTFTKGLVTEASPLTYPEDSSYDEDNCLLFAKGNRTRRLGAEFEDGYVFSGYQNTAPQTSPITEYRWLNVANNSSINFLCVQMGAQIYFYDLGANPISGSLKAFVINLNLYPASGATDISLSPVQMDAGKGFLFIAGEKIEPLCVTYDEYTDTIAVSTVPILIRDFDGVDDNLAVEEEIDTLSPEHHYNLMNQGWTSTTASSTRLAPSLFGKYISFSLVTTTETSDTIEAYETAISKYPGNHKQWFLGKDADGDFDPALLNKVHIGNSRAPRGHFVLNAFNKDRSAVSGVEGLPAETVPYRPSTVAFFSGRAWWGSRNNVYFSQIMTSQNKAGQCFQESDPTAEDFSELLPTDGGFIPIPAADEIVRLVEIGNGVMVFARNGVWMISGSDKGFSALEYQITKVSNIGTDAPRSIVVANDTIYWWSKIGIQQIRQNSGQFGPVPSSFSSVNITAQTIDTLFKSVDAASRSFVKGVYDPSTDTVHWAYRTNDFGFNYGYDRILNLDLTLGAFYPWSLPSTGNPFITGLFLSPELNVNTPAGPNFLHFFVADPVATNIYRYTVGTFTSDQYVDWETPSKIGVEYESFIESGFEILEDAFRKKQILYLNAFFRQTEETYVQAGEDYTVDKPSSCYLQVKWDWTNMERAGKWSNSVQAYRHRRATLVDDNDLTFNTGTLVVYSKNKIRGSGRALQFRFSESGRGNNFDLLGWQAAYQGNTKP